MILDFGFWIREGATTLSSTLSFRFAGHFLSMGDRGGGNVRDKVQDKAEDKAEDKLRRYVAPV